MHWASYASGKLRELMADDSSWLGSPEYRDSPSMENPYRAAGTILALVGTLFAASGCQKNMERKAPDPPKPEPVAVEGTNGAITVHDMDNNGCTDTVYAGPDITYINLAQGHASDSPDFGWIELKSAAGVRGYSDDPDVRSDVLDPNHPGVYVGTFLGSKAKAAPVIEAAIRKKMRFYIGPGQVFLAEKTGDGSLMCYTMLVFDSNTLKIDIPETLGNGCVRVNPYPGL